MILAKLLRRGSLVAALLLGGSLFTAAPALAHDAPEAAPASAKLTVKTPNVIARSWNGHKNTIVTPVAVNPRFPGRRLDPMAVQLSGVQPDSEIVFERQKQSHDVELPEHVRDEEQLKEHAHRAMNYTPMLEFKTTQPSSAQAHTEVTHDEKRVAWPNSRYRVRGKTRDGQEIPHVGGVVAGVMTKQTQVYDPATDGIQPVLVSGTYLPSARAWIKTNNLFVSEPSRDPKQIEEGRSLLQKSEGAKILVRELQSKIDQEQKPEPGKAIDQARLNTLRAEQTKLNQEVAQIEAKGKALVTEGERIRVRVVSVGATPASAPMTTTNVRLKGENTGVNTRTTQTEALTGYVSHDVDAVAQDHLETSITFAPTPNAAVGSAITVKYRVPEAHEKAEFEMGGIKYYRVKADAVEAHHDAAVPAP